MPACEGVSLTAGSGVLPRVLGGGFARSSPVPVRIPMDAGRGGTLSVQEAQSHSWHVMEGEDVLRELDVLREQGLTASSVQARRRRFGPNQLPQARSDPAWLLFLRQFQDVLVLVLLGATAISAALGEIGDAVTILAIVIMNSVLGYLQESRAERALQALKALNAPTAHVIREGGLTRLPAEELVPGDLVQIEAGDRFPADVRLLETANLEVEESVLTGESAPVAKRARPLAEPHLGPADQRNMGFMGTAAVRGRAVGVVVATGLHTQMGRIATLLAESKPEETPLQRRLSRLSQILVIAVLGVCMAVVAAAVLRGEPLYNMFLTGVSLGVAAIPEGLPAIVTVALALGVQRMARRNAIVRHLPAVEALGCATVVGSDKTGTLTRNEMTVRSVWLDGVRWDDRSGLAEFQPAGGEEWDEHKSQASIAYLLRRAAECCDAVVTPRAGSVEPSKAKAKTMGKAKAGAAAPEAQGDPTEVALVAMAVRLGENAAELGGRGHRIGEVPFESDTRCMTVLMPALRHRAYSVVKGAPDVVMAKSRFVRTSSGETRLLTQEDRRHVQDAVEGMAGDALRLLAVAERPELLPDSPEAEWETDLVWLGLVGMMDPPRAEARQAVRDCQRAGIRVVMITGDHPRTAAAVAREIGILGPEGKVVTGTELDTWDDARLARECTELSVLARVTPRHKLRMVRALRSRGEVVAMTGDGVNDAPAVKEADIGIAMGLNGTDVTKEAADVVLADDNFATIIAAVEEGRGIYDNVRKFVRYLLASNTGEVLTMFLAGAMATPMPLLPIQILWVNLVTDGLPALALGLDPTDPNTLHRPPRSPRESIFARGLGTAIVSRGVVIGLLTMGLFVLGLRTGMGLAQARTMAFAALTLQQLAYVFECRQEGGRLWDVPLTRNPWLIVAVLASLGLFLLTMDVPALRPIFATTTLPARAWLLVIGTSILPGMVTSLLASWRPGRRRVRAGADRQG